MRRVLFCLCWAAIMNQAVLAEEKPTGIKGLPPRFLTLMRVNAAKAEAVFDVQILTTGLEELRIFQYPDGSVRHKLLSSFSHASGPPTYVHPSEGYTLPLKKARWSNAEGKALTGEAAWKALKPGTTVVLSS